MVALTAAQLDEIWAAEESVACGALARLSEQTNYEADLRQSIHVDFLYQTLCFCREAGMSHTKALVIFEVMVETRAKAAVEQLSKEEAFSLWSQMLMERIKALPAHEAISLAQVQQVTAYATAAFFNHFELHAYVGSQERDGERRRKHVFVETAAVPVALAAGRTAEEVAAEEAAAMESAASAAPGADGAPASDAGGAPAAAADPSSADGSALDVSLEGLDGSIAAVIEQRVEAARVSLAEAFDARERELSDRIAQLEVSASSKTGSRPGTSASGRAARKSKAPQAQ